MICFNWCVGKPCNNPCIWIKVEQVHLMQGRSNATFDTQLQCFASYKARQIHWRSLLSCHATKVFYYKDVVATNRLYVVVSLSLYWMKRRSLTNKKPIKSSRTLHTHSWVWGDPPLGRRRGGQDQRCTGDGLTEKKDGLIRVRPSETPRPSQFGVLEPQEPFFSQDAGFPILFFERPKSSTWESSKWCRFEMLSEKTFCVLWIAFSCSRIQYRNLKWFWLLFGFEISFFFQIQIPMYQRPSRASWRPSITALDVSDARHV